MPSLLIDVAVPAGGGGAVTVTAACADLEVSAALVAVTEKLVPALLPAVNSPAEETVPPVADQVTAVLLEPVTVAVNCWFAPSITVAEDGAMETLTCGGGGAAVIVTAACADFEVSAALVDVTEKLVPAVVPAVNKPAEEIVPPVAVQVTAVLLDPVTVAVNCCFAPVASDTEVGLSETLTCDGAAVMATTACADLEVSAALVAVTEKLVPAVLPAVNKPAEEIVPPVAVHVTAVLLEPVTKAVNCCFAPVASEIEGGCTETATTGAGAVTVTLTCADFVVSATLVAVIEKVPAVFPAVNNPVVVPVDVMVPPVAVQVTASLVDPVTVAVNCCCAPSASETEPGCNPTETAGAELDVTVIAA